MQSTCISQEYDVYIIVYIITIEIKPNFYSDFEKKSLLVLLL